MPGVINDKAMCALLEMLNLLFKVLVAGEIDFVELILVDKVLRNFLEILVGRAVLLGAVSEEQRALFKGEGADLSKSVGAGDRLYWLLKEIVYD